MGEAYTKNPYTRGSANFAKVQKQINSNKPKGGQITISPIVESTHDGVTTRHRTQRGGGLGPRGGRNDPIANPNMALNPIPETTIDQRQVIQPQEQPKNVFPQESMQEKFKKAFAGATNPINNIDVTQENIRGFDDNTLETINARARVDAKEARERNFLKTGINPLDNVTGAFLSGSAFAGTALAEAGGAIGKQLALSQYKQDLKLKQKQLELKEQQKQSLNPYQNILKTKQLELELATRGGIKTKGKTIEQVAQIPMSSVKYIKQEEFGQTIRTGEQTGRLIAETIPYLNPATGIAKAVTDVGRSKTKEELLFNVGTGIAIGGATKLIGATGKLIPLKLNKYVGSAIKTTEKGLKFNSKPIALTSKAIDVTQKYGIPIVSTGLLISSGGQSIIEARKGNTQIAQDMERQLFSALGGMKLGGIAGDIVGKQLKKPIEKVVFKETVLQGGGSQGKLTTKQATEFKKFYNLEKTIKGTKPKDLAFKNLEALQGMSKTRQAKAVKILEKAFAKHKPLVQGSSATLSQVKTNKAPRKFGDIDVSYGSDKFAKNLFTNLKKAGFDVKIRTNPTKGTNKYHITMNGKELVNSARDLSQYKAFYESQSAGGITDFPTTSFKKTPSGVKVLSLKAQFQEKLYGGYMKKGRAKDIVDLRFIAKNIGGSTPKLSTTTKGIKVLNTQPIMPKPIIKPRIAKPRIKTSTIKPSIKTKTLTTQQRSKGYDYIINKPQNYGKPYIVNNGYQISNNYRTLGNKNVTKPYNPIVGKPYKPIKKVPYKPIIGHPPKPIIPDPYDPRKPDPYDPVIIKQKERRLFDFTNQTTKKKPSKRYGNKYFNIKNRTKLSMFWNNKPRKKSIMI